MPSAVADIVLFLDVDGCVAPVDVRQLAEEWAPWMYVASRLTTHLYLSPQMGEVLRGLPVQIKWLTTWEMDGYANRDIAPALGWEPLEILPRDSCNEDPWWKLHALLAHGVGDPFVWVDDQLPYFEQEVHEALIEAGAGPALLVAPDPYVGLTRQQVEAIREFAEEHAPLVRDGGGA